MNRDLSWMDSCETMRLPNLRTDRVGVAVMIECEDYNVPPPAGPVRVPIRVTGRLIRSYPNWAVHPGTQWPPVCHAWPPGGADRCGVD